ncbi:MAG TPA: hypothetical protein VG364_02560 [Candidatus Dormibacteraeota bacterium]|nr:hypothetical protein [Candidatus Dormibacteraeota bacterium]
MRVYQFRQPPGCKPIDSTERHPGPPLRGGRRGSPSLGTQGLVEDILDTEIEGVNIELAAEVPMSTGAVAAVRPGLPNGFFPR